MGAGYSAYRLRMPKQGYCGSLRRLRVAHAVIPIRFMVMPVQVHAVGGGDESRAGIDEGHGLRLRLGLRLDLLEGGDGRGELRLLARELDGLLLLGRLGLA